ncbi:MAG: glycoside hydrolase family 3 C-terminal domain-containing protein [Bifidobacteriaceae bacterium]|jgi:beta-glucosidase|nr:glycoside hydrolase family 3 C-terminal domain-containing protein [Bifidobacteriaceae bacterium]
MTQYEHDYLNPDLSDEERAGDLLSLMTREEKIGQLMQLEAGENLRSDIVDRHVGSILHTSPEDLLQAAEYVKQTRLRIPLLVGDDLIHGYSFWPGATIFPTQLTMAATWNPELLEKAARVTAREAAPTGIHWTFSPVLCIARDLRWGRIDETFGEDPFLIGEYASAMVRGYQGKGLKDPTAILATAKHFAGYSETQGGRDASEADMTHRKLASWFLPPFERVAREGVATFMLGYQSIDGTPITLNKWLLNDVLRGEWGYQGTLITDWDNVGRTVWEQKVQPDYAHAAAAALNAGNDLVMTTPNFYTGAAEALEKGLVSESVLDAAVRRVLLLKFRFGLFENPRLPEPDAVSSVMGAEEHTAINLEIARRSVVLLKNDGALPLMKDEDTRTIAVLGPLADDAQTQLGDWAGGSGQAPWIKGQPREKIITVLDGLRSQVPDEWQVTYSRGADILNLVANPKGETFPDGQPRPKIASPAPVDAELLGAAVNNAESADVSVLVVGDHIELIGEGRSTATLNLFGAQNALIDAVAEVHEKTGKPFVIVMMASKPLVLPPSAEKASAILWVGNPGMQGGRAIAEIMTGAIEPSGRLPISFARHVGQQPVYYNQIRGQHGDRYADLTQEPAFVFGQGLSYTRVDYSGLQLDRSEYSVEQTLHARVTLHNEGSRPSRETVQVYVRDLVTSVSWVDKELKAYKQVDIAPGETKTVDLEVAVREFSIVNAEAQRVVEPGDFELLVGTSSRDEDLLVAPFAVSAAEKE